ncbi:hypothetical protein MPTK1_5g17330 [Marchantia polymorpha subsp. ruderalis]|uniref:Protein kinase domain-containing protein n=2 Tax=Marchantia polymorpha TaxID=3197 RepID=A0AAF6BJB4_MARPO|nr:hypothetical protein MARPO_0182s0016 [Marchantia polymorpha]BBN12098.1 hypothetical protein Mp_5g17330 [Marchantia polymorpha subsp. ruderalis]|eukprot:PTQ27837.1 hypothetical protein MARPO_0182s0016 [Marchantia polymorpha]
MGYLLNIYVACRAIYGRPRLESENFQEIKQATNNFNQRTILDSPDNAEFTVYKGTLSSGEIVRVRRSSTMGINMKSKMEKELELLSCLYHRNVVCLVGVCFSKDDHLLVYEHLPNGTLSDHLHDKTKLPLPLEVRLDIAICIAKGLAHLHGHISPPIIHRNVKSSSILLGNKFVAKLSEFGLWKQMDDEVLEGTRSTEGYMPPEYYKARKYTNLSDVYGLGVVLLELLTGEKACDLERHAHNEEALLVRRIWSALRRGGWEALQSKLDPFIRYHPKQNLIQNLVNTALYCTEELETDRPDSKSLVEILENLRTFS